jgi:hypothetical protein
MGKLRTKKTKECFSLLKNFIEEVSSSDEKGNRAMLALNHLRKITAGTDPRNNPENTLNSSIIGGNCTGRPRIDG